MKPWCGIFSTLSKDEARNAVELPSRLNLATTSGFFRVMPAVMRDSGLMGYKVFHGSVQHGVRYLIAVYDEKDGRPQSRNGSRDV